MPMSETVPRPALGLSGRDLGLVLSAKYVILAVYGIWAAIAELPTFVAIGSSLFATGWAITVATFALAALGGIIRTWCTGHFRFEKWATAALVLVFIGYSFALLYRAATTENWDGAPTMLLPIALSILPIIRFYSFIPRKVRA